MSVFLSLFQYYILYSEEYITLMIDMISTALIIYLKKVQLKIILYYLFITAGYTIIMVTIKLFITISIMIANIIDIYLLGIVVVLVNILIDIEYFGLILSAYLLYLFLTRMEVFLLILLTLEGFSIIFQSLTLSNRLSINIMAGSLLISLLSLAIVIFTLYILLTIILIFILFIIYSFEIINTLVQLFIFNLLSIEYLLL